jgi:hypothetical protein
VIVARRRRADQWVREIPERGPEITATRLVVFGALQTTVVSLSLLSMPRSFMVKDAHATWKDDFDESTSRRAR